jgi:hypothetical protein
MVEVPPARAAPTCALETSPNAEVDPRNALLKGRSNICATANDVQNGLDAEYGGGSTYAPWIYKGPANSDFGDDIRSTSLPLVGRTYDRGLSSAYRKLDTRRQHRFALTSIHEIPRAGAGSGFLGRKDGNYGLRV